MQLLLSEKRDCEMTEYHADDYGLFPVQSKRIIDCCTGGVVNGISVMPNSIYLSECMELLRPVMDQLQIAVHLNFIEGHALCSPEQIPCLVDSHGRFSVSFGRLLLASVLPAMRKQYRIQLQKEIRAQIHAVNFYLRGKALRIDGHAHYHMIPVVFDALMDVVRQEQLKVSYIRIPKEKIGFYFSLRKKLEHFRMINLLKTVILNVLAARNQYKYRDFMKGKDGIFIGVMYSGRMSRRNMHTIVPAAEKLAEQTGQHLEILAHPGGVREKEDIQQLTNQDDIIFLTSAFREEEAAAFRSLKENRSG